MKEEAETVAFGGPGIEPRWASSAKEGFGTAYHTSCRLWFTLSHGIVNEIYYPFVDQPNTRDFQFLISDGETFCHEEKTDLEHQLEYPERACLFYRLINTEPGGRYRIVKQICADPHRSVLLIHTRLEIGDKSLRDKLRLYALLAPHIGRYGAGNSGRCAEISASTLLHARRDGFHLIMGCTTHFTRRSAGYVGASDGWQDLRNFKMDWEFRSAPDGNIALTGEIDPRRGQEFVVAIALGQSFESTSAKLLQSLADPFEKHRETYVRQWKRAVVDPRHDFDEHTGDGGRTYRLSRCVLLAHEDKIFQGALVASMSIPWGETKGDNDLGGYHLVWTRDLAQSATALLATGQTGTPMRALIWLAVIQRPDGSFPQNSWIDGRMYWPGLQLDEVAAPILLAWRLRREGVSLGQCDSCTVITRAAAYLILQGPVTAQERWEENAGYSPSTLAAVIAGLVCAADFAHGPADKEFILAYADWLAAHLEEWTVTTRGELVKDFPRHYIRINPTDLHDAGSARRSEHHHDSTRQRRRPAPGAQRRRRRFPATGPPRHPRAPTTRSSAIPSKSLTACSNATCRKALAGGATITTATARRKTAARSTAPASGGAWPILTGERGHYELAAGRDPLPFIDAMEKFANAGGMISEQLWDADDSADGKMKRGQPTGAAMPLCWSHAEYLSLVRSRHDGVCL